MPPHSLGIKSKKVEKEVLKEVNEYDANLGISEAVPLWAPKRKLSAKLDYERIIMGQELSDREINFAQQLLKAQHSKCNGLRSTLVMRKVGQFENDI